MGSTIDLAEDQHIVHMIQRRFREYYRILRLLELDSKIISNKTRIMQIVQKISTPKGKILKNELWCLLDSSFTILVFMCHTFPQVLLLKIQILFTIDNY